ncbi:MAG: 6,7-dimethyl-8-ribityllumazine synthase [Chloroflexi bacterium]|nr:6,7-dimethyl-8-ribityllumazine synthase [Chloroflexota bacterium]
MADYEGGLDGSDLRLAVVVSRFNEIVTEPLLRGALATAREFGVGEDSLDVVRVPGAFELPQAARRLAGVGGYDAIVCLGAVVRGETPHFDYVCSEAARGITMVAQEFNLPVAFGVLTCDTMAQARARSGGSAGNKGDEAMRAALEMANLFRTIG